jgi:DNA-binding Lrp family transcriptional regulator
MNPVDERLVRATEAGLPLVPEPYAVLSRQVGIPEAEVVLRLERMLADGRIRRIGAVPNHYALGYTANAMTVWDVDDASVGELGGKVGALPFVSHCYRRPRRLPDWPYNLFAMVHGRDRMETASKAGEIRNLLGATAKSHDILYSTRILKKTGLRLA